MVEEVKCPECGLAEGHAIMCGSKDYRRKKRKLSRNDPTPSVVKDGATGEGEQYFREAFYEGQGKISALANRRDELLDNLAAAKTKIALAKSALVTALATNDDIAQQLVKAKAEIEKLKGENAFHIAQMVKGDADNSALCAVLAQCEKVLLRLNEIPGSHRAAISDAISAIAGLKEKK